MAAGAAVRFGTNKLLVPWFGQPLYRHLLDALPTTLLAHTVVVSGTPQILEEAAARGYEPVVNEKPELGPGRTVRLGLERLLEMDACLFAVCDQPELQKGSLEHMLSSYPGGIYAAAFDGRRGNPVIFPASLFGELLELRADQGGSAVIRRYGSELSLCAAGCRRELCDVDTEEELQRLRTLRFLLLAGPRAPQIIAEAERQLDADMAERLHRLSGSPAVRPLDSLPSAEARKLLALPQTLRQRDRDTNAAEVAGRMREIALGAPV